MKIKLDCVLVVEGKTDTNLIKQFFDVETIETNGSELSPPTITLIKKTALVKPVILLLDPDYQGKKIQARVLEKIPECQVCFVSLSDIKNNARKQGIAEIKKEILIEKILKMAQPVITKHSPLNWDEYLSLNLNNKSLRLHVCQALKIPYYNHKQLFKKINMLNLNLDQLLTLIKSSN